MTPATAGPSEALRKSYEAAYNVGDATALQKLYTHDAVLMPPDGTTRIGAEGIKSYYLPRFELFTTHLSISVDETGMLGDWPFVRGAFTAMLTPRAPGEALKVTGKWLELCAVQPDGSWKIARHIWNSPKPVVLGAR